MLRKNFPDRRKQRAEEAAIRQTEYNALSKEERIARAQSRPGNSLRELRRLGVPDNG